MEVDGELADPELDELEAGANLLANPGFEQPVVRCPAMDSRECWIGDTWGLHGAGAVRMEGARRLHERTQDSQWGVRVTPTAALEYAAQVVPVHAGQAYRLRSYQRDVDRANGNNGFTLQATFYDGDRWMLGLGESIDSGLADGDSEGIWVKHWEDVRAPQGAKQAQIIMQIYDASQDAGDWDDIVFAPITP